MTDTPDLLHRFWGIRPADVKPLGGGMNSETWLVEHQGSTYVAKRVPRTELYELVGGCEIASALAGVHAAGRPARGPSTATFAADWLSPQLTGVEAHPWLAPAIEAVRAETDPLTVTWSVLHTDPSPEAFIHNDSNGVTGLIDWAGAKRGPILYDVASTVMYLGGPDSASAFLTTYRKHGPLATDEMQLLDAFRRFRRVVQAAYFAWRLAVRALTGVADQADNEKGLNDARRGLEGFGLDTA
jgi:homoserine kinase type II